MPFQLDCVPRKVLMSHSTSMPSSAKKPSSCATKSLSPMPFGATRTLRMISPLLEAIREQQARIVVRFALGDRARGGVALQAPGVHAEEPHPVPRDIVQSFHAERGENEAAAVAHE